MRRIKVILAVAALLVAMVVASAAPAMANTNDHFFRNDNGRFFTNNNDGFFFNDGVNTGFFSPFFFNDGFRNDFDNCLFLPAVTIC